ncbi:MAG: type II secretion system protein N [Pseudomonadota bacterium]
MYPVRTLIAVGVLAFLASLLLLTPARLLVKLAPDAVAGRISQVSGNLWQGQGRVATARGQWDVGWDLHAWRLLTLAVDADWTLSGRGVSAGGAATLTPGGYRIAVGQGELGSEFLGRLASSSVASIDRPLVISGVEIAVAAGGRVEDATGRLAWGPGTLVMRNRSEPLSLPAVRGMLRAVDGQLRVLVDGEQAPGELLASLNVDPAGNRLHLVVTQRGGQLAGLPPSSSLAPDAPFFELKQPLR